MTAPEAPRWRPSDRTAELHYRPPVHLPARSVTEQLPASVPIRVNLASVCFPRPSQPQPDQRLSQ
ncbi:MAG: hypothetical protein JO247_17465 [Chloroflexi bacterium]|nr:hypothetical protein [Chloroflexota bacterium]